jgi:bifunctional non-homologous end joining protein LigD
MQLDATVRVRKADRASEYAKLLAERLAGETPDLVTAKTAKALRPGEVLIDWSQNNLAKTTIAPYSLRTTRTDRVHSGHGDGVRDCQHAADLVFVADDILYRVDKLGDLFAPCVTSAPRGPKHSRPAFYRAR